MKVGEITQEHGEQAIAEQRFGYDRLSRCRSVRCRDCKFTEHGIGWNEPVRCFRCWSRNLGWVDTHYHLMFT